MTLLSGDDRIETERLVLRRLCADDLPFYTRIHANPDVARYLSHGRPRTPEETGQWLAAIIDSYRQTSLGQLAVTRKSDGALLGRCGLSHVETTVTPGSDLRDGYYFPERAPAGAEPLVESELGYTFDQEVWGNGFATEAVRAVREYAALKRPDDLVASLIHADNARSRRLAERFGVERDGTVAIWGRLFDRYVWPAVKRPSTDR